MTSIGSSDQNQLQAVDNQLQQYIQQAQAGQQVDAKSVASLQQQISTLANNPNIPPSVQQGLQAALNELKQMQTGQGGINNLYSAKMQLDNILGSAETQGVEPTPTDQGVEGGSLGGGGSGGSEEQ